MIEIGYIVKWVICLVIVRWVWKIVNWVWFTPKRLEKFLRKQGLDGNSYRFLLGDLKDMSKMRKEARQKPIPFTHDFFHRILPFHNHHFNKYG